MKSQSTLAVILLALLATGSASAGPFLIGGRVADLDPRSGVINLYLRDDADETRSMFCTASKVAPDLILTAAHCVHRRRLKRVGFSNDVTTNTQGLSGLEVTEVLIHPSYFEDENILETLAGNDVALVRITPTSEFDALRSIPVSFEHLPSGRPVQIWGFGCRSSVLTPEEVMVKKVGTSESLPTDSMHDIGGNFPDALKSRARAISTTKLVTGGKRLGPKLPSLCDGDSGGPVLFNGALVGVNSTGIFNDLTYEGKLSSGVFYLNLHNRLSNIRGWLQRYLP